MTTLVEGTEPPKKKAFLKKLKWYGTGIMIVSPIPYVVLATLVNIFAPETIRSGYPFSDVDDVSNVGAYIGWFGFTLGVFMITAGWIINGSISDKRRALQSIGTKWEVVGKAARYLLPVIRLGVTSVLLYASYIASIFILMLLALVVGR